MKALAAVFDIGANASRVGVITFSSKAEHSIKMRDHTSLLSFNEAVDKIPLMGSITRIDRALRLAQKELFNFEYGARPGIPKLLILLTDGVQTKEAGAEDPSTIADEMRSSGMEVVVVGVGTGINKSELVQIAGGDDYVFTAESFDKLLGSDLVKRISRKACSTGVFSAFVSFLCFHTYILNINIVFVLRSCFL